MIVWSQNSKVKDFQLRTTKMLTAVLRLSCSLGSPKPADVSRAWVGRFKVRCIRTDLQKLTVCSQLSMQRLSYQDLWTLAEGLGLYYSDSVRQVVGPLASLEVPQVLRRNSL